MHNDIAIIVTSEHGHNIVNSANCQQYQVFAFCTQKGAHNCFFVKSEMSFALSRS